MRFSALVSEEEHREPTGFAMIGAERLLDDSTTV
jgi:hypothetical protein